MDLLVGLHVGSSLQASYAQAFEGGQVKLFSFGGASSSYDGERGIAARWPNLASFLRQNVPEWAPGHRLALVAFSAGCWAPRAWMRMSENRELVDALVLLDGLHSGYGPGLGCDENAIDGVLAFGSEANQQPTRKGLIVTHTSIVPPGYASTTSCAKMVNRQAGAGVLVKGFEGTTAQAHLEQVRQVGPSMVNEFVRPLFRYGSPVNRDHLPGKQIGQALIGLSLITVAAATLAERLLDRRQRKR
jgi:hypothetical protein